MSDDVATPAPAPKRRITRKQAPLIFAGIVLGWVLLTVLLGGVARYEIVCLSCHSKTYAAAQTDGSHSSITCQRCHRSSGTAAWLNDGLAMQRRILSTVTFQGVKPTPLASDRGCRQCHAPAIAKTFTANGITVRHADFITAQCPQCHGGTGHRIAERTYPATRMDDCLQCHQTSPSNVDGCALCHVEAAPVSSESSQTVWRAVHGPNWDLTHGAGDLDTCDSCHPRAFCARCHDVVIPHPAEWPRRHGKRVVVLGDEECWTCHDDRWCDRCHRLPMPHADSFMEQHPKIARSTTDPTCLRCHDRIACDTCHTNAHVELKDAGTPHQKQVKP